METPTPDTGVVTPSSKHEGDHVGSVDHKVQSFTVLAPAGMLVVIMVLSTVHLGVLIGQEIWKPPRGLIPVPGLLEIFGYLLLVLIGVELLETLRRM